MMALKSDIKRIIILKIEQFWQKSSQNCQGWQHAHKVEKPRQQTGFWVCLGQLLNVCSSFLTTILGFKGMSGATKATFSTSSMVSTA